ncbi:hypothetical protein Efla_002557 [Eimeria flavescens]
MKRAPLFSPPRVQTAGRNAAAARLRPPPMRVGKEGEEKEKEEEDGRKHRSLAGERQRTDQTSTSCLSTGSSCAYT